MSYWHSYRGGTPTQESRNSDVHCTVRTTDPATLLFLAYILRGFEKSVYKILKFICMTAGYFVSVLFTANCICSRSYL